jgi:succinyl-diaminopimelate desuccinylase
LSAAVNTSDRADYETAVRTSRTAVTELCRTLVRVPSENPPGDTVPLVSRIESWLADIDGIVTRRIIPRAPAASLLIRLLGDRPGRRLVMNGHLDTFPAGEAARWTVPPYAGEIRDGCLYGRGTSDMKVGVAAALMTLRLLAARRHEFAGELVLTLAGDEESGSAWGTEWLLRNVPEASGDAMLNGDAGAPEVLRFGEKGRVWLRVTAFGKASHGAHVHLGENAIDRLMAALARFTTLHNLAAPVPADIIAAIAEAAPISEPLSGAGEAKTLTHITVNIGTISGGSAINIVPDRAESLIDIRFPPGVSGEEIRRWIAENLEPLPGIAYEILACDEPNWTSPTHEIVAITRRNAVALLGDGVVANMRVGFSDARFYRQRDIPSVVYGPRPFNMGAADEHVLLDDIFAVFYVHAMTAYDYLMEAKPRC